MFKILDNLFPEVITNLILGHLPLCELEPHNRIYTARKDDLNLPVPTTAFFQTVWEERLFHDEGGIRLRAASFLHSNQKTKILSKIFTSNFTMNSHYKCNEGFVLYLRNAPVRDDHRRFITDHWRTIWLPKIDKCLSDHTELHLRRSGMIDVCIEMIKLGFEICDKTDQELTSKWIEEFDSLPNSLLSNHKFFYFE